MSFTATITETINIGGLQVSNSNTFTDEAELKIDKAVAVDAANYEIIMTMDESEIAVVYIVSDQDLLLQFNNSTTGVPEINLLAGKPYLWYTGNYNTSKFDGVDVTILYVTNTSGSIANLQLRFLYDATPS